jgi:methylated-DNA-[protein]-cysteine S-methyltransferase
LQHLILHLESLTTPTGPMLIATDEEGRLRAVDWQDHEHRMQVLIRRYYGVVAFREASASTAAGRALSNYFAGDLAAIDDLAVAFAATSFQKGVWTALRRIPAGETLSYGALAGRLGRPQAARAVGHANGANPVSIIVPCHRLIGANADLTGYGGGIERKRWLLAHEVAYAGRAGTAPPEALA